MSLRERLVLLFLFPATLFVLFSWLILSNINHLIQKWREENLQKLPFLFTLSLCQSQLSEMWRLDFLALECQRKGEPLPAWLKKRRKDLEEKFLEGQLLLYQRMPSVSSLKQLRAFHRDFFPLHKANWLKLEEKFQKEVILPLESLLLREREKLQREQRELLYQSVEMQKIHFMAMALVLLLSLLLGFFTSGQILRPLEELGRGAREIGRGNFNIHLEHKGKDELAKLISTFNHMVAQLRETTIHAKSLYQIIQCMEQYVILLDRRGNICQANESLFRDLGFAREELEREPLHYLFASPDPKLLFQILDGKAWRQETEFSSKYGQSVPVILSSVKLSVPFQDVALVLTAQNIAERKKLEKQILEARDEERQRLAQDLHDSLGQELVGIKFMLEAIKAKAEKGLSEKLQKACKLLERAIQNAKSMAESLSSVELERQGLLSALSSFALYVEKVFSVSCQFFHALKSPFPKDSFRDLQLYRIVQEAVQNSIRHGEASQITIILDETEEYYRLQIRDNGKGFVKEQRPKKGLGLTFMEYRVRALSGLMEVHSRPGEGTQVICFIPKEGKWRGKKSSS